MKEQTSNTNPESSATLSTRSPLQLKSESIQELASEELEGVWGGFGTETEFDNGSSHHVAHR